MPILRTAPTISGPDAELLALCARLVEMQATWQRLYVPTSDGPALITAADRNWQRYSDDVWPHGDLAARLAKLPALTPAGMAAKAASILALEDAAGYCDSRDDICEITTSVLRDVAGDRYRPLGAGCTPAPAAQHVQPVEDPADLVRLAARHRAAGNHLLADAALLRIPHSEALPPTPRALLLTLAFPA